MTVALVTTVVLLAIVVGRTIAAVGRDGYGARPVRLDHDSRRPSA